ncbi:serine/threonine-protein kinase [Chondromyces apiculatus]|uniref:Serine/threonine-protein kinase Pkn1 n=1 Tax=Chondromyces apiculatus DSM 436 TaxID=1192034 RepID=A0A017SXH9_9BACT|nr:serine/threonine-protein kinase [Chondromyces apiculatus]EYF01467.1 serine/threonine-protein kinase Pkn1 [Chondromyces apiculatus DSM 436]
MGCDLTKELTEVLGFPLVEDLPAGSCAGAYLLESRIARGGCGAVYSARHCHDEAATARPGERVAVKVLHAKLAVIPKMVERFIREVQIIRRLNHPNVVAIRDVGTLDDGRPFYVMERLEGMTLESLLRSGGRMSPAQALQMLEPVCAALQAAHDAGVVHRDVKANNIFVGDDPSRSVKLLDFGIAKLMDPGEGSGLTTAGRAPGTLSIMAPEQILGGTIDARVDIYALGVLLHRLLTGQLPFDAPSAMELARQHLEEPPPRPSQRAPLAPALDALVLRCLEKQPERRFPSVTTMLRELREAVLRPGSVPETVPELSVDAMGVHVVLRLHAPLEEIDDALADDLGRALDLAEITLRQAGLCVVSTAGDEVLGVRLLPGGRGKERRARADALALAVDLHDRVAGRPGADDRVHVNVCLHADQVLVRSPLTPEIVGGPLACPGAWTPQEDVLGLCATPEAIDGLSGLLLEDGPGRLLIVRGSVAPRA